MMDGIAWERVTVVEKTTLVPASRRAEKTSQQVIQLFPIARLKHFCHRRDLTQ